MISHRDVVRTLIACEFGTDKCMALWVTDSTSCRKKKRQKKQEAFNKDSARNESGGRSPEIGFRLTLAPASGRAVAKRVKEPGAFATSKGPHKDLVKPWDLQEMHFTRSQRRARYYCSRVIGCYINDVNGLRWVSQCFLCFGIIRSNEHQLRMVRATEPGSGDPQLLTSKPSSFVYTRTAYGEEIPGHHFVPSISWNVLGPHSVCCVEIHSLITSITHSTAGSTYEVMGTVQEHSLLWIVCVSNEAKSSSRKFGYVTV